MENNIKGMVLLCAIVLTGLSAGLFYAWYVSVIPGTKRVADHTYLETMQSINRAILNPGFFIIFFGSLIMLLISGYYQYLENLHLPFYFICTSIAFYMIGTLGITMFGNVPLNESLAPVNLSELSAEKLKSIRAAYEGRWNLFHAIRTLFSVLSFITLLIAAFINGSIASKI
ncbi:DUF1772 domain-containing protein [Fulvivirgaceae bacterium BMA10]|uniref:DUF1772 domain-containing protein n=1 Tax=Splendidivirga corallicola TaxID=3051826 RepID=A0ABT8KVR9_9BACT|nr:DUF1772 domain-containing protein [Fulvivirgaceae bacterium BMA10]